MIDFDFTVIRSARRSVGITVREGKVIVRAPARLSDSQIISFIEKQRDWIRRKINDQGIALNRYSPVREYKTVMLCGVEKNLKIGCEKNSENGDTLCLKSISDLRGWTEKNYSNIIFESIYRWGKIIGAMPSDLQVRDFKAKWGSCDAHAVIKINWRILFLRDKLQQYIFIHELCHLKHLNHSAQFWKEVARYCPDYKTCRKELKSMAFLTEIYRNW